MTEFYGLVPENATLDDWEINLKSTEIDILREHYQAIPQEQFDRMLISSQNILAQCPNPDSQNGKKTGLAVGKIQSGKTLSFTSLVALASSNHYSIIIVLAGTKKALFNQTYERLRRDLGVNNPQSISRLYVQKNPNINALEGITNALGSGRCALFIVLKHSSHIDDVIQLVRQLPNRAVLIIDDEADEASLNNYFRSGTQSTIYASITNLRNALNTHAYVAYTATPQAHLLLDDIDHLSPDFCELIEPGPDYCGGAEFFGPHINNYIREVSDVTQQMVDEGQIPNSLNDALAVFFVGAVIRHIRAPAQRHSMLIHLSRSRVAHVRTVELVQQLLRTWRGILGLRLEDSSRVQLIELFHRAYKDLSTTVNNILSWEDMQQRLPRELSACEVHMVNSLPQGVQIAETTFQLENNIVVGGNILGRGLTILELAVSYMARRAKTSTNADTVEQRARWFGYKRSYLDLCRIFIPTTVRNDYQGLLMHEDDFWEALRRNQAQGIALRKWPRLMLLDFQMGMNPTRSSVARYERFRPTKWRIQNKPVTNQEIVKENIEKVKVFLANHKFQKVKFGGTEHLFCRGCNTTDVIKLIREIKAPGTNWDSAYVAEYLERLFIADVLQDLTVVQMAEGNFRKRSLEPDGTINQLMQGPSSTYPGDRELHNDQVQLQIHYVKCQPASGADIDTTALAIYIPEEQQFDLSFIIRGENQ